MILSASNLAILRQQPHNTKLYLSVYQPTTVMACTLNTGTVGRGDRTIPYVSVTTGSISNVEADYTLLVGTTAGARDVGTVRIRSGTASTFLVAENSDIQWSAGQYLTVLKYVDIWPVYPVIDNSTDPEVPVFYKDTDVPYTNQNSILGSFPVMGCHQAIKTGGNAYWSASGTYNVLGDSLAYTWEFEGGSPATSSAKTPGLVSYAAAGNYVTKLTVSGSSGGVDVSYRYVIVEDNPSVLKWELTSLRGSRAEGGYIASVKVYQILDSIKDGALVMIWADDTYGATKVSLGGNSPSASQVVFVGYIQKGSITYNWRESSVEFEIGSVTEIMKAAEGFGVSVESKTSPTTWYELLNATVTRFIYHYLRWHTTVLKVADFRYTGQDYSVQYFDSDRASLYDALYSFVNQSLHADVVADRQGAIWVEIGAKAIDSAKSLPLAMSIDKQDWMGDPTIEERLFSETSYVEGGGIAFSGATGSFAPFKGCSPGNSPSYRGKSENMEGMIVTGQDHLNRIVGNIYAYENSHYPTEDFKLAGNYRNLDIAPLERVTISLAREENARGVVWNAESFHIDSMDWEYDEQKQFFSPTVTFAQLTEGVAGETIVIPEVPPDDGYGVSSITIPKIPNFVFPAFDFGISAATQVNMITVWGNAVPNGDVGAGDIAYIDLASKAMETNNNGFYNQVTVSIGGLDHTFLEINRAGYYLLQMHSYFNNQNAVAGYTPAANGYFQMQYYISSAPIAPDISAFGLSDRVKYTTGGTDCMPILQSTGIVHVYSSNTRIGIVLTNGTTHLVGGSGAITAHYLGA